FAVDVRQAAAGFDDYQAGTLDHGPVPQIRCAQIEVAVLVHRAGLEHDDIHRIHEAPVVIGDLAEIDRDVATASGVVHPPVSCGEMQAEGVYVSTLGIALVHRPGAHRQAVA